MNFIHLILKIAETAEGHDSNGPQNSIQFLSNVPMMLLLAVKNNPYVKYLS